MDFVFYDSNSNLNEVLEQLSSLNAGADVWLLHQNIREQADVWASYPVGNADILFQNKGILTSDFLNIPTHLVVNWLFLRPDPGITSNAWRSEGYVCFFKKGVIAKNGGFDGAYSSLAYSISDFHYRALMNGASVRCLPLAEMGAKNEFIPNVADEFRFAIKIFGFAKINYIRCILFRKFGLNGLLERPAVEIYIPNNSKTLHEKFLSAQFEVPRYSVIIPTIDRYSFLPQAIDSLLNLTIKPDEIIIVDQTPIEKRIPNFYERWGNDISLYYLDQAGQCTSRNFAIMKCRNEFVFLYDDDSEIYPDALYLHFQALFFYQAAVSTGVSIAPNKQHQNGKINKNVARISDVLDSGNALVRKKALFDIGMFNLAFDKGSGADDDLGRRLFLSGHLIIFNPYAVRIHHKAPSGGMRVHGSWWRNKSAWNKEFPPATQVYTIYRYYGPSYLIFYLFLSFLKAMKTYTLREKLILMILLPYKLYLSINRGKLLYAANKI